VARRAQIDMLVRQRDELQGQLTFLETESATLQTSLQTVFDRLGAARHRAASRPAGR
jgi:prefoldin subunit 5